MGERNETPADTEDDLFDAGFGEFMDDSFEDSEIVTRVANKASLAAKRRRAEQRLEALRLREELGDYDFSFEDDF